MPRPAHPRAVVLTGLALLVCLLPGCSDQGPSGPSGPGSIYVDLISPNGAEGSAVFELRTGVEPGAVISNEGDVFFRYDGGTGVWRVVVVNDLPGVVRFRIRTMNVRALPEVSVLQVADGGNELRPSVAGYGVEMTPVEEGGAP